MTEEERELINLDIVPDIQEHAAGGMLEPLLYALAQTAGAAARIQRNLNRRMVLEELFMAAVGRDHE